jgi:hypothetical protein
VRRAERVLGHTTTRLARLVLTMALVACCGCAFLYVTPLEHVSTLTPRVDQRDSYLVGDDGSVTYQNGDLQILVEPMSDAELNRLYPEESSLGEYSINPYTFGNWVDPDVGYVRNRFTVFRVTVHNRGFAKVELDPLRAVLTTDRRGEVRQAYGILAGAAPRTFEAYYRARRRPSGNEYYRFNMRMGIVRSSNYGVDETIFNGESYGGYIVFDPLDEDVRAARLTLRDFTLKFNAFDMPLESVELVFDFQRQVTYGESAGMVATAELPISVTRLRSPSLVNGAATGDTSRDPATIDALIGSHLPAVNGCFDAEFVAGTAAEGQLDLRYTVGPEGTVHGVELQRSTIVSAAAGECIQAAVGRWDFGATGIPVELLVADPQAADGGYLVTVMSFFEFTDARGSR